MDEKNNRGGNVKKKNFQFASLVSVFTHGVLVACPHNPHMCGIQYIPGVCL